MTHTQTTYTNRIALRAGKKGARPAEVGTLASVFEKSATMLKRPKLLKCKQTLQIATFNVRTLNRIGQLSELIASVSTDHRIVIAKIRLSLRKNAKRTETAKHYDWALLNNRDIRDKYVLELRNRFETLQEKTEKSTPNDEYENFVNAHLEAAAKCIPTKLKTKYRVSWGTLAVREKRALVKTASKNYRKDPTNINALKLKTAQYQLSGIYIKEQTEYIQNQIDKIRASVEDRQSRIAWQTINEVSRTKNTAKAKLKAANKQERIKLWKQHFKTLLGKPTENNTWTNHQNN